MIFKHKENELNTISQLENEIPVNQRGKKWTKK